MWAVPGLYHLAFSPYGYMGLKVVGELRSARSPGRKVHKPPKAALFKVSLPLKRSVPTRFHERSDVKATTPRGKRLTAFSVA